MPPLFKGTRAAFLVYLIILGVGLLIPAVSFAAIDSDLQMGSKGPKVLELQNLLISKGYLKGVATGNFFSLTKSAVITFQKANGISGTGYVGSLTRSKLNALGGSTIKANAVVSAATPSTVSPVPAVSSAGVSPTLKSLISQVPFNVKKEFYEFSGTAAIQTPTAKRPPESNYIDPAVIQERSINPRAIVLVRCQFVPTYTGAVVGGDTSPVWSTGTGVVVSPDGYILTAEHVLRIKDLVEEDTARIWTRKSCEISPTDAKLTPINASLNTQAINPPSTFIPAQIAYEPSDKEFNVRIVSDPDNPAHMVNLGGGADLDFVLLKVSNSNLPYIPIIPKLLALKPGEKLLGIGYPGVEGLDAQHLERIDTLFNSMVWSEASSCQTKTPVEQCGIQYQGKRYKADYKNLYGMQTELGQYTSYVRGGFSGGPLFYKGYVAGLMIYSNENPYSNMYDLTVGNWNWVGALSTSEIYATLQKKGISLPTAL